MKIIKKWIKDVTPDELENIINETYNTHKASTEFTNLTYLNIDGKVKVFGFIKFVKL